MTSCVVPLLRSLRRSSAVLRYLEADELAEQLVDAEFREAAGVLEMISQSPEDRQFYEARMKFLHDEEARLIAARTEGEAKGRECLASG